MTPKDAFANSVAAADVDANGVAITPNEDGTFRIAIDVTNVNFAVPTRVFREGAAEPVAVKMAGADAADSIHKADKTNKYGLERPS